MASLEDIAVSAGINLLSTLMFLLAFAFLRLQPLNDRVYFPKWYLKGARESPRSSRALVDKFVNLNFRTYFKFWSWMPAALEMPENELIDHAGLDSAVFLRIYLVGLRIFCPITIIALVMLVPINLTGRSLSNMDLMYSSIDKLSISNVPSRSFRFIAHILMAYIITMWTFYVLYNEYKEVCSMRLHFLASEKRRADQYTVLVRNIPHEHEEESVSKRVGAFLRPNQRHKNDDGAISKSVEEFFRANHPDHYLSHQLVYDAGRLARLLEERKRLENWLTYYETKYERNPKKRPMLRSSCWGICGGSVDAINHYAAKIKELRKQVTEERQKVMKNKNAIVPSAFVSFNSRWGAAVCAQTQQTDDPTVWLTEWAPEPRDVHWNNLARSYAGTTASKLLMAVALFFLTFFFMIPIAFVQSLASIEGIQQVFPFLKPIIANDGIKALIQGFLPGIALKIFLIFLPSVLMTMSKAEGYTSRSSLERRSAGKFFVFLLVNVFIGSIVAGAAFEQLHSFLNQSPSEIPKTIGVAMPMKAGFFITYIMVDGWAGIAAEILRVFPLIMYHLKNTFLVKTEQDKQEAMHPGSLQFAQTEPQIQLYLMLGLVYAAVSPILLPFIIIFFAFSYVVYRHQIINVYHQKYESGATFWPDVHRRIIFGLIMSQLLLTGLLTAKGAPKRLNPALLILPVMTIWFHRYCKSRFEFAFKSFPLQTASKKDKLEKETEPDFNLKEYLQKAYVPPIFQDKYRRLPTLDDDEEYNKLDFSRGNSFEVDIEETMETGSDAVEVVTDAFEEMEDKRRR